MKTREDAQKLLNEWVIQDSLRSHCLGVAVCMEAYAKKFKEEGQDIDVDMWYITGLLHDFDWERFPSIEEHPIKGCQELKNQGYNEGIIESILGDNPATGIPRRNTMAKTLFAVDELSGLVTALAKVRPGNFSGMSARSVKKAMKKKDFAAAINREDIKIGMEELSLESDDEKNEHFELVIKALSESKEELGFDN